MALTTEEWASCWEKLTEGWPSKKFTDEMQQSYFRICDGYTQNQVIVQVRTWRDTHSFAPEPHQLAKMLEKYDMNAKRETFGDSDSEGASIRRAYCHIDPGRSHEYEAMSDDEMVVFDRRNNWLGHKGTYGDESSSTKAAWLKYQRQLFKMGKINTEPDLKDYPCLDQSA